MRRQNAVDAYRKRKRESMARRRAADPEAARAYQRAYHQSNREKQNAKMRNYASRRFFWRKAVKLKGDSPVSALDLAVLWKRQRGRCALTGRKLDRAAQLDHKMPRARGGTDELDNLQWLCAEANLAKRDMTDADFVALCADVARHLNGEI